MFKLLMLCWVVGFVSMASASDESAPYLLKEEGMTFVVVPYPELASSVWWRVKIRERRENGVKVIRLYPKRSFVEQPRKIKLPAFNSTEDRVEWVAGTKEVIVLGYKEEKSKPCKEQEQAPSGKGDLPEKRLNMPSR